jgi:23S rRNA (uracil1939-C5)-methyltransferase
MQIKIEKMIYGGDGLGRLPADESGRGKTAFVPFVLPDEVVEIRETEVKPSFVRAEPVEIIQGSAARVEPSCEYFGRCGGCQYQHVNYDEQLKIKAAILTETLARGAKLDLPVELQVHSAEPWQYRNRTRLKVQTAPAFAVGYHRSRSHQLLPVRHCPISSPLINRVIGGVWEAGENDEVSIAVREVQCFASHDGARALLEIFATKELSKQEFERFAVAIRTRVPEVAGVIAFEANRKSDDPDQTGPSEEIARGMLFSVGEHTLNYRVAETNYRVSAGSFFQTNRFLVDRLMSLAIGSAEGNNAFDLYAGAGLFTVPLASRFARVTAVEASPHSSADLAANAPKNVKCVRSTTEDFLRTTGAKADFVLVDPPRAGLGEKTAQALGRMHVQRVTYVSCDPSTLSRDLRVLLQSGFRVEQAHLVDLFPQTYHLESVFHLVR